jgi:hypothetical protein
MIDDLSHSGSSWLKEYNYVMTINECIGEG